MMQQPYMPVYVFEVMNVFSRPQTAYISQANMQYCRGIAVTVYRMYHAWGSRRTDKMALRTASAWAVGRSAYFASLGTSGQLFRAQFCTSFGRNSPFSSRCIFGLRKRVVQRQAGKKRLLEVTLWSLALSSICLVLCRVAPL